MARLAAQPTPMRAMDFNISAQERPGPMSELANLMTMMTILAMPPLILLLLAAYSTEEDNTARWFDAQEDFLKELARLCGSSRPQLHTF